MARTSATSIFSDVASTPATKDALSEAYGGLIDAVQKNAISTKIKNTRYSGDPTTGSVEVSRYENAVVKAYGTARTAGAGDKLNNSGKVTINLDQNKELVEEVAKKDLMFNTVPNLVAARTKNHADALVVTLDKAFFTAAEAAATKSDGTTAATTLVSTTAGDAIEELVQNLEATENDYVKGVDRSLISVSMKPAVYGEIRTDLDSIIGSDGEEIVRYHGVRVFSNYRQTADLVAMVDGSVAQPVVVDEYALSKIPLSDDFSIESFPYYGTKAVTPDLIRKGNLATT